MRMKRAYVTILVLTSSFVAHAQQDALSIVVAPSFELRPFEGEAYPVNGLLLVQIDFGSPGDSPVTAALTLGNGDVVEVDDEQRCGTGSNFKHCVTIGALPGLVVGEEARLDVEAPDLGAQEAASFTVVAADETPPAATPARVAGFFRTVTALEPDVYSLILELDEFPAELTFVEVFEETDDGPALLTVERPRTRNGLPEQRPEMNFILDDATEREACFTIVLHDVAGNELAMERAVCQQISAAAAETRQVDPLTGCGCTSATTSSTMGALALLLVLRRTRRSRIE